MRFILSEIRSRRFRRSPLETIQQYRKKTKSHYLNDYKNNIFYNLIFLFISTKKYISTFDENVCPLL